MGFLQDHISYSHFLIFNCILEYCVIKKYIKIKFVFFSCMLPDTLSFSDTFSTHGNIYNFRNLLIIDFAERFGFDICARKNNLLKDLINSLYAKISEWLIIKNVLRHLADIYVISIFLFMMPMNDLFCLCFCLYITVIW